MIDKRVLEEMFCHNCLSTDRCVGMSNEHECTEEFGDFLSRLGETEDSTRTKEIWTCLSLLADVGLSHLRGPLGCSKLQWTPYGSCDFCSERRDCRTLTTIKEECSRY